MGTFLKIRLCIENELMNSFLFLRKFERRKGQVLNRLGIPYAIIREDGSIFF
jgi:hypothetical protein